MKTVSACDIVPPLKRTEQYYKRWWDIVTWLLHVKWRLYVTYRGGGGVLGAGIARKTVGCVLAYWKRGSCVRAQSEKKGGGSYVRAQLEIRGVLGAGHVKNGGSLPRHILRLDIYISAPPPPPGSRGTGCYVATGNHVLTRSHVAIGTQARNKIRQPELTWQLKIRS